MSATWLPAGARATAEGEAPPDAARAPVSVCLACFNGERHIAAQVRSVLENLQPQDELIISDDGSQDGTVAWVQQLADPRIRLLRNTRPLGVVRNFEQALGQARQATIFLCDQDDIWAPGKVERCLRALEGAVLVVTDCHVVDARLQVLHPSFFALRGSRPGMAANLWKNGYLGCCMAFRSSLLHRALPFPQRLPMHDMWLGLVAETCGTVVFLPEPLSLYRRHASASSDAAGVSSFSRWQQLNFRLRLLYALALRVLVNR